MSWIWAALMPHPPIIVPEVGKGREKEAKTTLEGTEALLGLIRNAEKGGVPDVLFVLSPHLPYVPGALFLNTAPRPSGTLARFGAPAVSLSAETPAPVLAEFSAALKTAGIPVARGVLPERSQDHGSLVPLYYLAQVRPGGTLPPVILANPSGLTPDLALALGDALRSLNGPDGANGRRLALLASGDLSHRLKPGAPSGYSPDGAVFDKALVASLRAGDPAPLFALSPETRKNAGECGFRPSLALLRLTRSPLRVLSYEGPFGVGYCNAFWQPGMADRPAPSGDSPSAPGGLRVKPRLNVRMSPGRPKDAPAGADAARPGSVRVSPVRQKTAPAGADAAHPYARLARQTVAAHLRGNAPPSVAEVGALSPDATLWAPRKGCFVSIKTDNGSLRGCIGTFLPTQPGLAAEIMINAVAAATRDPRFPPMRPEELDKVQFSVDVLSAPEPVREGMELNPAVYGVIVSKGGRRGLLLPDLPGVATVEKQLSIAAAKGGIDNLEGAQISRFTVDRYPEKKRER